MKAVLAAVAVVATFAAGAEAASRANWATTVSQTPAGAFVLGNPRAKVRLVEYLSLTCNHCAAFSAQGWPALKQGYISTGAVSLEVRHAVRDPVDLTASMVARCGGNSRYFQTIDAIMAQQESWLPLAARAGTPAQGTPIETVLDSLAKATTLDAIAATNGISAGRLRTCLSSKRDRDRLAAMTEEAWRIRKIGGTPSFLINDQPAPSAHDWHELEPLLAAAIQ